jgi:hypothetical protein
MKVVCDKDGTILGRWRGYPTGEPWNVRYEVQGVSMFADDAERFKSVYLDTNTVQDKDVFECDFCNALKDSAKLLKIGSTRPSDPYSACSIMWGCTDCGNGKPDAVLAAEYEAQGIGWEG